MSKNVKDVYDEDLQPEPRWHAVIAFLTVGGLWAALPRELIVGPRWLFLALVIILLIPTYLTHEKKYYRMNRILGFIISGVVTLGMIISVFLLIKSLPDKVESAAELLTSAAALWITNILVFALWYWRLDAGGPHSREKRLGHPDGSFLFPQMTLPQETKEDTDQAAWSPNFVDYLFIAFNTSTAFSPTDAPVLDRWAKVLMMLQSIISLTVLALLAARAVNIF